MPRKTQKARAEELGITRDILMNARNQGLNIWSDEEMLPWVAGRRPKVAPTDKLSPTAPGHGAETVADLKEALKHATEYNDVRILHEKLKAMAIAQKLEKESGHLLTVAEVDERDIRIGSAVRAAVLKLCNDTAPMVEGLDAAGAHRVLSEQGKNILDMLSQETTEFWHDHEQRISESH